MKETHTAVRYTRLVMGLTALDLRIRFAGSKLGLVWLVLAPLLTICAYLLLFGKILKVQVPGMNMLDYGLLVVAGLLPWIGFSESITRGTASVLAQRNLMKSRLFPMELIPVTAVCAGILGQLCGTILLLPVLAYAGKLSATIIFLPILILLQGMLSVGVVWFLSCVNILYRDTSQVINLLLLLLMFVSPIAYTPDMIPNGLSLFVTCNPLSYLIEGYRNILLLGQLPSLRDVLTFAAIAAVGSVAGYRYFVRLRRLLPDFV